MRRLRAQRAAHLQHAQGKTNTGPARAASMARFERMADPEGVLAPAERAKRARQYMLAHMRAMQRASVDARRERRP